jgi:hypothetical protein
MKMQKASSKIFKVISAPHINTNDLEMEVIEWYFNNWDYIEKGITICDVETTKATMSIESDHEGYIYKVIDKNKSVKVGEPIAYVFDTNDHNQIDFVEKAVDEEKNMNITKKARHLLEKNNLSINDFPNNSIITSDTVIAKLREVGNPIQKRDKDYLNKTLSEIRIKQNSVIIYGEMNNALTAIDTFHDSGEFHASVFLNNTYDLNKLAGIPCLPPESLKQLCELGLEKVFLCGKDKDEIKDNLNNVIKYNMQLVNAVHSTAFISNNVTLKGGVYIGPKVVLGPEVSIGSFSKVLNASTIAHHSIIGDYVTISDGTHIGGNVNIGDNCYIGIGVNINKRIEVGERSTIVSGCTIIDHVQSNSIKRI